MTQEKPTTDPAAPAVTPPTEAQGPSNWDRHELDFEHQGEEGASGENERDPKIATWNKGQLGEEWPDGHSSPDATDAELATSEGGLSGGGANSGGGERFGETEK